MVKKSKEDESMGKREWKVEVVDLKTMKRVEHGPMTEKQARKFFEVEKKFGSTAALYELIMVGVFLGWLQRDNCGDWGAVYRYWKEKKKV